jgi:solute:Na+ symporter, SSS family
VLIFLWRRLTPAAVWTAVIVSAAVNIIAPLVGPLVPAVRANSALVEQTAPNAAGRREAVFFESVVRSKADDPASPVEGRGRLHVELVVLDWLGIDMAEKTVSTRFAARFFFDGLFPFALLIAVSFFTRQPEKALVDRFYGKMKTPVGKTPELEEVAMAETMRNPHRMDDRKLFRNSSWEFTKWDRVDTIGFLVCCVVSGAILGAFALLLKAAV